MASLQIVDVGGGNPFMGSRFVDNSVCGIRNKPFFGFLNSVDVGDGNQSWFI